MKFNSNLFNRLRACHQHVETTISKTPTGSNIKTYHFSDSTFIVYELFNDDPMQTYSAIISQISSISSFYTDQKLPLRGSLSFGKIIYGDNIVIGKPVVKAVSNEQLPAAPIFWTPYEELPSSIADTFLSEITEEDLSKHTIQTKTPDYKRLGRIIWPHPVGDFFKFVSKNRLHYMLKGPSGPAIAWDRAYNLLIELKSHYAKVNFYE